MRPDADVIREMIAEANEQAAASQAKADLCWALDLDGRAEDHVQACATHQARARVLSKLLAGLEPEVAPIDPGPPGVHPGRPAGPPALVLHTNHGAACGSRRP